MAKAILIGPNELLQSISALWKTRLKSVIITKEEDGVIDNSEVAEKIQELQQQLIDKQVIIDELQSTVTKLQKVISNYEEQKTKAQEESVKPKTKSKK